MNKTLNILAITIALVLIACAYAEAISPINKHPFNDDHSVDAHVYTAIHQVKQITKDWGMVNLDIHQQNAVNEYLKGPVGQQYLYRLINNSFNKTEVYSLPRLPENEIDYIFQSLFNHLVQKHFIK